MRKFYSNTGIRSEESRPKAIKSFGNKFLEKLYLLHCTGNDEKRKGEEPHHFILQRTTIRDSRQIQTSNKSFNVTDGIYKVVPSLLFHSSSLYLVAFRQVGLNQNFILLMTDRSWLNSHCVRPGFQVELVSFLVGLVAIVRRMLLSLAHCGRTHSVYWFCA